MEPNDISDIELEFDLEEEVHQDPVVIQIGKCRERIASLADLQDGWHDGTGKAPSASAVAVASVLIDRNPTRAGIYSIFPTENGGLLFEFVHAGWDYSVEIRPDGSVEVYGIELNGTGEMESGPDTFEQMIFHRDLTRIAAAQNAAPLADVA